MLQFQNNANYVEIDQIYPLTNQDISSSNYKDYSSSHSPIYQNTSESNSGNRQTTPIYSNTSSERFRRHSQGMTYGETLAHHLRHNLEHSENTQGKDQHGLFLWYFDEIKLFLCLHLQFFFIANFNLFYTHLKTFK